MRKKAVVFLATGTYLGLIPFAPGTFGTLWGVIIAFFFRETGVAAHGAVIAAVTVVSIFISGEAVKIFGTKDPSEVVCDEVAGFLAAFFLIPFTLFNAILVFILFRFFDIVKPYPVSYIDRTLPGGAGIVLDDIMAGIYANIAAHIILLLLK
ncbi:MAG: phosphatidylglycerophosphatase A [Thermodesulfobacteriota bacterium]